MPDLQTIDMSFLKDMPVPGPAVRGAEATDVGPREFDPGFDRPGGQWPRMLNLDEDVENRLKLYLDEELRKCYTERQPLIDDWTRWQTDYWARPERAVRNFPFRRAANVVVPLTAIAVEAIYARLLNTIFSVKPLWSIRPKTKSWIDGAKPFERWLQNEVENENSLNAFHFFSQTLLELIKLGTCAGKSGYERDVRKTIVTRPDGSEETRWIEVKNGATLHYLPIANFLIRLGEDDPQTAPWVGEEHEFSWGQLKRMALSGRMWTESVDKIKTHWEARRNESGSPASYQNQVDKLANVEPVWNDPFKIKEIWLSFDVDGDNVDEEIVVDYHVESRTLLSVRYNWYADLHRPYRTCPFIPVEGRIFGIGVGKQNEQFQREATTIHRQRLDNATLANMGMLRVRKTTGYGPDEPIFPGKMWFVDDHNDITPFKLSEVYSSSYANEESVVRYSEKRTGVNEVLLGMPQQGTPGTATSDLARLAEGNKKFDLVLKNVRRWSGLLGYDVVANFQQFGAQERHWLVEEEKGQWVEEILRLPQEHVMNGAMIELTVTDSITNRDVEQRQWMSLFQIITNYYQTVVQFAQLAQDPTVFASIGQRAMGAADEAMKRLLESFNIPNVDDLLLLGEEAHDANAGSAGTGIPGTAGENPPSGAAVGMEQLLRLAPTAGRGAASSNGGGR